MARKRQASSGPPNVQPVAYSLQPASAEELQKVLCERVRALRRSRKWTLDQLATASGVSRSMLSEIERGKANPTLGVAYRIAEAFGLPLVDLVGGPARAPAIEVVDSHDNAMIFRQDAEVRIRTLHPLHSERDVEYYELTLRPDGKLASAPHYHGTRELITVARGSVRITAGPTERDLAAGDSARYPADVPHTIENTGIADALAYLVVIVSDSS